MFPDAGACLGGCDDGNDCTDDACIAQGCSHSNNTNGCADDGNECTNDVCDAGTCTHPNRTGACTSGGNPHTDDACDNGVCLSTNNSAPCTDENNECTNDVCSLGFCQHQHLTGSSGTNDDDLLAADTTEALAAVINIPPCAAVNALASSCTPNCRAFEVTSDNSSKFVVADDQGIAVGNKLRARASDCGSTASTWESWEFIAVP